MKFLILAILIFQSHAAFSASSYRGSSSSSYSSTTRQLERAARQRERDVRRAESEARLAASRERLQETMDRIKYRSGGSSRSTRINSYSNFDNYAPAYYPPPTTPREDKDPGRYSPRNSSNITIPSPIEYHQYLLGAIPQPKAAYDHWSAPAFNLSWVDGIESKIENSPGNEFNRYRSQVEFIVAMLETMSATDEKKIAKFESTLEQMIKRITVRSKYSAKGLPIDGFSAIDRVEEYVENSLGREAESQPYTHINFERDDAYAKHATEVWALRQAALMEFDFEVGIEIGTPLFTRANVLRRMERTGWFDRYWTARYEFTKSHGLPADYILGKTRTDEIGRAESDFLKKYDFLAEYKRQLDAYLVREGKAHGQYFFFRDVLGIENTETHIELMSLPREEKLKVINEFQDKLREKIDRLRHIGKEVAESKDVDFKEAADQRFFELLLTSYFSDFPDAELALVVRDFAIRPYQNSSLDLFNRLVLRAGPQFQKLMQILGRKDGFSPELRKVFSRVEDGGLPTPYRKIDPPKGYEWEWMKPDPFVGSIAQSYQAKIKTAAGSYPYHSPVVIAHRVLKTGIKDKISEEGQRLIRLAEVIDRDPTLRRADFPLIGPILDDIKVMAFEELDLKKTAENQILGKQVYTSTVQAEGLKISFVVPDTFDIRTTQANPEPQSLDSTWLEGDKFENFQSSYPGNARIVAEQIAKLWIGKAFSINSFFHSDLHQGNMKILGKGPNEIQVGFLDFGMSDSLTAQDKATLIKLGVELTVSRNPKFIADYIWQLSNKDRNLLSLDEFRAKLKAQFPPHKNEGLDYWLRYGLSVGVALKKNINSFSRGLTAIEQILTAGKSTLAVSLLIQRTMTTEPRSLMRNGMEVLMDHVRASGFYKKSSVNCSELLTSSRSK